MDKIKVYDIDWDTDGNSATKKKLPKEIIIEIPEHIKIVDWENINEDDECEVEDMIDHAFDEVWFCVFGYKTKYIL